MNRLQGLLIAVSATSFAAGIGVGLALPEIRAFLVERLDGDDRYVARLRASCDLRPDQVRDVRAILSDYNEAVRRARDDEREEWVVQSELTKAQALMDKRIFWILDAEQRERYRGQIEGTRK